MTKLTVAVHWLLLTRNTVTNRHRIAGLLAPNVSNASYELNWSLQRKHLPKQCVPKCRLMTVL